MTFLGRPTSAVGQVTRNNVIQRLKPKQFFKKSRMSKHVNEQKSLNSKIHTSVNLKANLSFFGTI